MNPKRSSSLMEKLEDRILFDAVPDGGFLFDQKVEQPIFVQHQSIDQHCANCKNELIIVDSGVENPSEFIDQILNEDSSNAYEFQILDGAKDGIAQISEILEHAREKYDAIHIVSHGDEGKINLGQTELSNQNLLSYTSTIQNWGDQLSQDADVLFYGCELAGNENGIEFVNQFSQMIGADIAASTDVTGHEDLGGDWDLEYEIGAIEATALSLTEWKGELSLPTFEDDEGMFQLRGKQSHLSSMDVDEDSVRYFSQGVGFDIKVNAAGFRAVDGYAYGITHKNMDLVRIGSDGSFEVMGSVSGLPDVSGEYYGGDFADDDLLYVNAKDRFYGINVDTGAVENTINLSDDIKRVYDIAFDADAQQFYGASSGGKSKLYAIEMNGQVTEMENTGQRGKLFGAAYTDADGNIYASDNRSGDVFQFDKTTGAGTLVMETNQKTNMSDGFSVILADGSSGGVTTLSTGGIFTPGGDGGVTTFSGGAGLDLGDVSAGGTDHGIDNNDQTVVSNTGGSEDTITDPLSSNDSEDQTNDGLQTFSGNGLAPLVADDVFSVQADETIIGNLFADNQNGADVDLEGDDILISAVNNQVDLVGNTFTLNSGALVTVTDEGSLIYNPNGSFDHLTIGETAIETFSYDVSDGANASTGSVTINVVGTGGSDTDIDGPVARQDNFTATPTQQISGNLFADNGNGPDTSIGGNSLTVTAVQGLDTNVGETIQLDSGALLTVQNNGSFFYDTNGSYDALLQGESATEVFSYELFDGTQTTVGTVIINIAPEQIELQLDGEFETSANSGIDGNVFANNTQNLSVVAVNGHDLVGFSVPLESGAYLQLNSDGSFNYDPSGAFDDLLIGTDTTDSFEYSVDDGTQTTVHTAEIKVVGTATATNTINGNQDQVAAHTRSSGSLINNSVVQATSLEAGQIAILAVGDAPVEFGTQIQLDSGALLTIHDDGTYTYDPNRAFNDVEIGQQATDTFEFTLSDGNEAVNVVAEVTIDGAFDPNTINAAAGIDPTESLKEDIQFTGLTSGTTSDIVNAGDINNDGIDDYLVGDWDINNGTGATYAVFGQQDGDIEDFDVNQLYESNGGDGTQGFVVHGNNENDRSGISVAGIGDVNADGIDDFIIGATDADVGSKKNVGVSYVMYGGDFGAAEYQTSELYAINGGNGERGYVLKGTNAHDLFGYNAEGVGDVNADGIDDFAIATLEAEVGNEHNAGRTYVFYGSNEVQPVEVTAHSLSELGGGDGSRGFIINAQSKHDHVGAHISGGADVNGDLVDDLVVTARNADGIGEHDAGQSFVIFGSSDGFDAEFNLADLLGENGGDGSQGMVIHGVDRNTGHGGYVDVIGDVNGDGIGELLIGSDSTGSDGAYIYHGGEHEFKSDYFMNSLKPQGVYLDNLDPRLYESTNRYMNNVSLQSTDGLHLTLWGDQTVHLLYNGQQSQFDIGYGIGSITLSTGTVINWQTSQHEHEYWPFGRPVNFFTIDYADSDLSSIGLDSNQTVIDQIISLSNQELLEFAFELQKFAGPSDQPLAFNG